MKKQVLENIKKYNLIKKGDLIFVGVSGGIDSVVLLSVLNDLKKEVGFELKAIHVNHNLRGEESDRDQKFVEDLCLKLGVSLLIKSVEPMKIAKSCRMTIEQACRELRYAEFRKEITNHKTAQSVKVAVAHNQDDQAETVLMHLFRGAGIEGVAGMKFKYRNIIRPLLNISREEIEQYANKHHLKHIEDSSNKDTKYTRNFIRREILPNIEKVYPKVKENICSFALKSGEFNTFVESKLNMGLIEEKGVGEYLLKNEILNHSETGAKLLIKQAFKKLNNAIDIEEKHINQVFDLFDLQVGKKLNLPHSITAMRTYDGVVLDKILVAPINQFEFSVPLIISSPMGDIVATFVEKPIIGDGNLYFDYDKLPKNAIWRAIEKGDKFTKFSGGTKNLSSFLTDKKIDLRTKQAMMVLAKDSEIFVVPGVEISNKLKIDEKTNRVVCICLKK